MTYSSTLAVNRQRFTSRTATPQGFGAKAWGKNQNVTGFQDRERRLGPVSNTIVLIVLTCILGLLYLTQVVKTNAYGYRINELQKQQTAAQVEHDELEITSARLQSLERVRDSEVAQALVPVTPAATVSR